jgi:hypothetical protein
MDKAGWRRTDKDFICYQNDGQLKTYGLFISITFNYFGLWVTETMESETYYFPTSTRRSKCGIFFIYIH